MGGRDPICHPNCLFRSPLPPYLPLSHIHTLSCPCWIFVCSRILWHQKPNCSELISLLFCFYFGFVSPRQSAKQPQQCKPLHPGWSKSGSRSNKKLVRKESCKGGNGKWARLLKVLSPPAFVPRPPGPTLCSAGGKKGKMASQRGCENGATTSNRIAVPWTHHFFSFLFRSTRGVFLAEPTSEDEDGRTMGCMWAHWKKARHISTAGWTYGFVQNGLTDCPVDNLVNTHTYSTLVCWIYKPLHIVTRPLVTRSEQVTRRDLAGP